MFLCLHRACAISLVSCGIFGLCSFESWAYLLCGMWGLSSLTRDRTQVPYAETRILNHWTTRGFPGQLLLSKCVCRNLHIACHNAHYCDSDLVELGWGTGILAFNKHPGVILWPIHWKMPSWVHGTRSLILDFKVSVLHVGQGEREQ